MCSNCTNTNCLNDYDYDCSRSNVKCNCLGIRDCAAQPFGSVCIRKSQFSTIFVNDSVPRVDVPMRVKPRGHASAPWGQCYTKFIVGHHFDDSYQVRDNCTEFPIIEFGTKGCTVQATYGCGHLSHEDPYCSNCIAPTAAILNNSCPLQLFRIGGDEFLTIGLVMFYNTSVLESNDVGHTHKNACDFDPDNDGFIPDFFVELKNRPGCLASLRIEGSSTFMVPVKWNRTGVDNVAGLGDKKEVR